MSSVSLNTLGTNIHSSLQDKYGLEFDKSLSFDISNFSLIEKISLISILKIYITGRFVELSIKPL